MSNSLAIRIRDFLITYPPFSMINPFKLQEIALNTEVCYYKVGEYVFKRGLSPLDHFFITKEGAIHLTQDRDGKSILIDKCDEGDVFGLRPLLAEQAYQLDAIVSEEALLYAIPNKLFKEEMQTNSAVASFLASCFAAGVRNIDAEKYKGRILPRLATEPVEDFYLSEIQNLNISKFPVTCSPSATIVETAKIMKEQQVGSIIIVDKDNQPIGIATDKDLRNRVIAEELPPDSLIEEIMTKNVITAPAQITIAEAQIALLRHKISHLCITENGSGDSSVIGVDSRHPSS